jgi:O-antigen ligase
VLARRRPQALGAGELAVAAAASVGTLVIALAVTRRLGTPGLVVPLVLVLAAILLTRPLLTVALVVGLTILCEGSTFGILTFTSNLYQTLYKNLSVLDGLVALAVAAVGMDLVRKRRPLLLPRPLVLPLCILALAMVAGAFNGYKAGASLRFVVMSEDVLVFLALLPLAIANLDVDRRQLTLLAMGALALAIVKAVLGLLEIAGGRGAAIEGSNTLTYYEPTANWLIMLAILGVFAALLARVRPPLWVLLGSPLLVASLLLSYRRSFWIGAALALLLVLLLGTSPVGRRLLVPAALGIAVAVWLLGSINFQTQLPLVKRAASLSPTSIEANAEDRYRLDERANVIAEIRAHPITGLGMTVPWSAAARTVSVEHPEGRQYVHFAALWYWLKLGILGLIAYAGVILAGAILAWRAWRRSREPALRAFGLASLCAIAGLVAIETTASFTGIDSRFTVVFATQLGLLALVGRTAPAEEDQPPARTVLTSVV